MTRTITNFGHNIRFTPTATYVPQYEDEVLDILARHAGGHVRAVGALHSWSDVAATDGAVIDMRRFRRVHIQRRSDGTASVMVGAGCRMNRLARLLDRAGLALPTVGSVLKQAIAGVIATGTHGSGPPSVSHFVEGVRFAAYDESGQPRIYEWSEGDELRGARCSLGCLGVVLSVRLRCVPAYHVREELVPIPGPEAILAGEAEWPLQQAILAPHVWDWYVYRRQVAEAPGRSARIRAWLQRKMVFVGRDILSHAMIKALAFPRARAGPTRMLYRRLFARLVRQPPTVDGSTHVLTLRHELYRHVEMEVLVPQQELVRAMEIVRGLTDLGADAGIRLDGEVEQALARASTSDAVRALRGSYVHHYPIVVRRVMPDDTLISMSAGDERPRYAVSLFTYERDRDGFDRFARIVAETLVRDCGARLHWGKHFPLAFEDVAPAYPRLDDFKELCRRVDPGGVFRSEYTRRVLGL